MLAQFDLSQTAQHWVNFLLIWIGFGTLAGLAAKALLPGREPRGTVGTVVIGVVGSVPGPLLAASLLERSDFNPISPIGMLSAVAGAFLLLVVYRLVIAWRFRSPQEDAEPW